MLIVGQDEDELGRGERSVEASARAGRMFEARTAAMMTSAITPESHRFVEHRRCGRAAASGEMGMAWLLRADG